jgi:hypothetical protein
MLPGASSPMLSIAAYNWSATAVYVLRAQVNGVQVQDTVEHDVLFAKQADNLLEFWMSETPAPGSWVPQYD